MAVMFVVVEAAVVVADVHRAVCGVHRVEEHLPNTYTEEDNVEVAADRVVNDEANTARLTRHVDQMLRKKRGVLLKRVARQIVPMSVRGCRSNLFAVEYTPVVEAVHCSNFHISRKMGIVVHRYWLWVWKSHCQEVAVA